MSEAGSRGAKEQGAPPPYDWKGALRALEGETPPPKLREALAALAVHGRRLRGAVRAYGVRVARSMADPAERDLPLRLCHEWPEWVERAAALASYYAAKREVAEEARGWAESFEAPEGIPSGAGAALVDDTGRGFALAVAAELGDRFPGPCSTIRLVVGEYEPGMSLDDAKRLVLRHLSTVAIRELSSELYATLTAREQDSDDRGASA